MHMEMMLIAGLALCLAVVDSQRILHTLQDRTRKEVTNQVAVITERAYTYLTCTMDGDSIQWLFQNGTAVPVFQPFTQSHTRQGVVHVEQNGAPVQYLAISPFVPSDQGFYRCLSVKNGLSSEIHVGLFLDDGLEPREVTVGNATTDGFMVHWSAPAVGLEPVDGFLIQATSLDTKRVVESTSLAVDIRDYQFICLQPNSTFTVTVSAVYGTVERSFSPLPVVNTTAGTRPEVCSTSSNSSNTGPALTIPAPEQVTVSALPRPGVILVTWSVPTRPLWLAITGYVVTVTDVSSQQIMKRLTKLPNIFKAEVTGLKLGYRYEVKVALDTSRGDGMFSNSTPVVTNNVPERVVNVTTNPDVSGMEASIRTHWIAPHSDITISHYIIKYTLGGVEMNAMSTSEEAVKVVKKGTVYLVAVAAVSAIGVGSFSDSTTGKSYDVPELVPANVTSISSTSVTLHWVVKPSLQFQLPILHYNLSYSSDQLSSSILLPLNTSMHKLTGLIPGSRYTLSLSAYNRLGEGPGHNQVVTTLKAPPPGHVTATPLASLGQLYINWTRPSVKLQSSTPGYLVRYRERGTNARHRLQSSTSNKVSTTLTGLKAGTVYEVEVAYVIHKTIGLYSPPVFVQTFDVPQVVSDINATAGEKNGSPNIRVAWSPPYSDVPIDSYDVTLQNSSHSVMQQLTVRGDVSVVIGRVERGKEYLVSVLAVSAVGKGKDSQSVTVRTFDVPAAPELLSVLPSVRDGSPALNVSWSRPHSNITLVDFVVEYWGHTLHVHSIFTDQASITLPQLALGTMYFVRVAARSALGQGQFTAVQEALTLDVPPEVVSVTVLPSVMDQAPALNISWEPPTYSLPIAYYRVHLYSMGTSNHTIETTKDTVLVMEMLDRGVKYEVYVIAVSVLGEGPRGEVHRAVTHDVPGPPGNVRKLFVEDDSVLLYWCCAGQGALALQYVLTEWRGSVITRQFTLDDPFYHVRGLDSNTQYVFSVQAVNKVGVGADKNITITTLPGRPLRLEVMPASSTALKVRWLPPVNHNRGPIVYDVWCTLVYDDDVQVSVARNQTFFGLSGTNVMLTSLLPHKVYVVRVTARNEAGSSHSSAMHARTFSAIPSASPRVFDIQATSPHSATIRWSPPPWQHRNGHITSYTVSVSSSEGDVWQRNTTATADGAEESFEWRDLYQNGHFVVVIAATNVNGTGPFSKAKNFTTPLDVPGQPHNVLVEHANTSAITLTWSGSQTRNNHVESYFVNYTAVDEHMEGVQSGSKVVKASQMYCLLSGLDEFREYSVVVAGENAVGRGAPSSNITFRTPGKEPSGYPSVLGYPLISSTSVQIQIAEIGYLDQNGPVTNYTLHYAPLTDGSFDDARSVSIEASGRMLFHLNKLRPFTMYRFQIQGINDFGTGPVSPFAEFMTAEDVPGQPQGIQVQVVNDSCVQVRAQPPTAKNGNLTDYQIEMRELESNQRWERNVSSSASHPGLEHIWCNLEPEVPYEVHVSASTRVGPGPAISTMFFTREGAAPHSVSDVTVTRTSDTSVLVSWDGLTPAEAKGFPLYVVLLKSIYDGSRSGDITQLTSNTSAVLTDVDPATTYEVSVTVYTGAGLEHGAQSEKVTLPALPQADGRSSILDSFLGIPYLLYYIIGGAGALAVVICLLILLCLICCCLRRKKQFRRPSSGSFSPKVEEDSQLEKGLEVVRSACSPTEKESVFCSSSHDANCSSVTNTAGCPDESAACDELSGQNIHAFNMI